MTCTAYRVTDLTDYTFDNVEFGLSLPAYTNPEMIHVDDERIAKVAEVLGSSTLRIVTEAGPVSERVFGASLSDDDWQPKLGNTFGNNRDVPQVRVVAGDDTDGREIDWVILNTSEMVDRFQEKEHRAQSIPGMFTTFIEVQTAPIHASWALLMNGALKQGLRQLANERKSIGASTAVDVLKVQMLTRGKAALAHVSET